MVCHIKTIIMIPNLTVEQPKVDKPATLSLFIQSGIILQCSWDGGLTVLWYWWLNQDWMMIFFVFPCRNKRGKVAESGCINHYHSSHTTGMSQQKQLPCTRRLTSTVFLFLTTGKVKQTVLMRLNLHCEKIKWAFSWFFEVQVDALNCLVSWVPTWLQS